MDLVELRQEYENLRQRWRALAPSEHRAVLAGLQELHVAAEVSTDEGTEQLLVEIEDLQAQIGHRSTFAPPVHSSRFIEPSDAM